MRKFTRGAITVQENSLGVITISLGENLEDPETEIVGHLHKDYINNLISSLRFFQSESHPPLKPL